MDGDVKQELVRLILMSETTKSIRMDLAKKIKFGKKLVPFDYEITSFAIPWALTSLNAPFACLQFQANLQTRDFLAHCYSCKSFIFIIVC